MSTLLVEDYQATTALPQTLLRDQVAIVTGGSRGIGRATALRFAEAGAQVIVNYAQQKAGAEDVVAACRDLGAKALAVRADVSDARQAADLIETAFDQRVPGYESWWDVPIAEVSESEAVRAARRNYEEARKKQRYFFGSDETR